MPSIKRCTSVAGGVATFADVTIGGATGAGVPTGGTASQALTKIDSTNYNTQWTTIPALTDGDKGDIVVASSGTSWLFDSAVVTAAAKTVLDDTTVAAMLTTLGGVPTTRTITPTAPLTGGGALSANLTLDISTFTLTVKGAVPPPTTATGRFLKDDGTWAVATGTPGAGTVTPAMLAASDFGDFTVTAGVVAIDAGVVTLAKMANLAQDQFIGRVTASTGVPETATITAAARTVLDDTTTAAMLTTLGAVAKIGDSITGMLSITTANAGLRLMRTGNTPYIEFYDTTGVTNYGFIQFGAITWAIGKGGTTGLTGTTTEVTANLPVLLAADPLVPLGAATKQYADNNFMPLRQTVQQASGVTSWSPSAVDENKLTVFNAATAIAITVPTNATSPLTVGYRIDITQTGAGKITVTAVTPGTTTITATPSAVLRAAGSMASLIKTGTDTWILTGDLT